MNESLFDLSSRSVIITGASRGIGLQIAECFLRAGSRVFLSGLNCDEMESAAEGLRSDLNIGPEVIQFHASDIGTRGGREALILNCLNNFGLPTTLILNAAIDIIKPTLSYELEDWTRILNVNTTACFFLAQAFGRIWIDKGLEGSITMISSIAGSCGIPDLAPYSASKAAINQLTKSLAVEWAPFRIRVNAVAPGYVASIMEGVTVHDGSASEQLLVSKTPMGRRATRIEVAGPVLFLASDAASYITGSTLMVDGGYSAQ